jgi:capsular exopolysaccharide synthesis family protein
MVDDRLNTEEKPAGAPPGKKRPDWDIWDLVHLLMRNRACFLVLMLVSLLAATVEHYSFPSFKVKSILFVQDANNNPLQALSAKLGGLSGDEKEAAERYLMKLRSFDYYLAAAGRLKATPEAAKYRADVFNSRWKLVQLVEKAIPLRLHDQTIQDLSNETVAQTLASWITFGREGTDSISITISTPDKKLSLLLSNLLSDVAVDSITAYKMKELNEAESYLQIEQEKTRQSIRDIDDAISQFKQSNRILNIESGSNESSNRMIELQKEIAEVQVEKEENDRLIETLVGQMKQQEVAAFPEQAGRGPASEEEQGPLYKYGVGEKIKELRRKNEYLQIRLSSLNKFSDGLFSSTNRLGEQRVFDLRKKLELEYSLFQDLKKQLFQIEMMKISSRNKVRVLDRIRDFEVHVSYSLSTKLALAFFFALLSGGVIAYVREFAIPIVDRKQDLEALGMTFLGNVPLIRRRNRWASYDLESPKTLAFRHIRARIMHFSKEKQGQKIAVLSAQHKEGKTFVAQNLAECLGHMKKQVLLIDCDLRSKVTSASFGKSDSVGLGEILQSDTLLKPAFTANIYPGVDLLAAGRVQSDITDMIASDAFGKLLDQLTPHYDFIILDTPPVNRVPDAALAAQKCDQLIFVASYNRTNQDQLKNGLDNILDLAPKPVYAVLNQVTPWQEGLYLPSFRRARSEWLNPQV